jgi:hypothetical protein
MRRVAAIALGTRLDVECSSGRVRGWTLVGGTMRAQPGIAGLLAFLAVLVGSERASRAISIDPVAQMRTVLAEASAAEPPGPLFTDSSSLSAPDFALFDESVSADVVLSVPSAHATASQRSEIGPLSVTGSGALDATSSGGVAFASGGSSFSLTFDLPESSPYQLVATLFASSNAIGPMASSVLQLTDVATNQTIVIGGAFNDGPSLFFIDTSGVLSTGRYRLDVNSQGTGQASTSQSTSFGFTFTVIPEPSTALLLAVGLAALAGRRNRRRSPKPVSDVDRR